MATKKKPEENTTEHLSQMSFGKLLEQFVGDDTGGSLSSYSSDGFSISPATLSGAKKSKDKKERPKANEESDSGYDTGFDDDDFSMSLEDITEFDGEDDIGYDENFDIMIEGIFESDENVEFRNNLIALGRKYSIKGLEEATESSEVNRAFIRQEQALGALMEAVSVDENAIQRDIEMLRAQRTRNLKGMADILSVKSGYHTTKLNIIKEMNAIASKKFDITMKMKKEKNEGAQDTGMAATQAVQRLLSIGRNSLMPDDEDEYVDISSGSNGAKKSDDDSIYDAQDQIHLASDVPEASSDGDFFIEHEGEGVEYVLDISSEDDSRQIYAVNRHGEVVEDYPMPSNPDQLKFQLNELAGEATDQLMRTYRLRRDGVDVEERPTIEYDGEMSE